MRVCVLVGCASHDKVLIVVLQERQTHQMVWLGWARAQVAESDIESYARDAIPEIVAGLPNAAADRTPATPEAAEGADG